MRQCQRGRLFAERDCTRAGKAQRISHNQIPVNFEQNEAVKGESQRNKQAEERAKEGVYGKQKTNIYDSFTCISWSVPVNRCVHILEDKTQNRHRVLNLCSIRECQVKMCDQYIFKEYSGLCLYP